MAIPLSSSSRVAWAVTLGVSEDGQVGDVQQPRLGDGLAPVADGQVVAALAHYPALLDYVHGQRVVAGGHHAPNVVGLDDVVAAVEEGDFVGQADADERAARTLGAVFERRGNLAALRHATGGREQVQRAVDQRVVERHANSALGRDEVYDAAIAAVAMRALSSNP